MAGLNKNSRQFRTSQAIRSYLEKTTVACSHAFSRVFASSSDWLIGPFASVVIGQSKQWHNKYITVLTKRGSNFTAVKRAQFPPNFAKKNTDNCWKFHFHRKT